jgi:hypothetical protein
LYELDLDLARSAFATQVAASRTFGDLAGLAFGLSYLGHVAHAQGDSAGAVARYEESLAIYREIDFERGSMSSVLRHLGDIALEQGDHARAQVRYAESLACAQEAGAPGKIAAALEALARLALAEGMPHRALRLAGAATTVRASSGQSLPLAEQAALMRTLAQARQALNAEQQAAEWAAGQAMTLEQATVEAVINAHQVAAAPPVAPAMEQAGL